MLIPLWVQGRYIPSYFEKELCSCILQAASKTFVKQSGLFLNFSLSHTHPLTHTRTHNTLTHSDRYTVIRSMWKHLIQSVSFVRGGRGRSNISHPRPPDPHPPSSDRYTLLMPHVGGGSNQPHSISHALVTFAKSILVCTVRFALSNAT